MSTLLHLSSARAPSAAGLHNLGAPLVLVTILLVLIGIIALSAVLRSASTAIAVLTQPTLAMFRLLIVALVIIAVLVAVLVSQPAEANNKQPAPAPTRTSTTTPTPASAHHR